jgi:hypothetical protein
MKYKGILAKPRRYRERLGLLASEADWQKLKDAICADQDAVIAALCKFHKVPAGDNIALLIALLSAHVPAWREEKAPRGRKAKWGRWLEGELRVEVDDWIAVHGGRASVLQACGALASNEPWRSLLERAKKDPVKALSKHYYAADPRAVKLVRAASLFRRANPGDEPGDEL